MLALIGVLFYMSAVSKVYMCNNLLNAIKHGAYYTVEPHLAPPATPPVLVPPVVILTCGQDAILPTLEGLHFIVIECEKFNGTYPLSQEIFRDGVLIHVIHFD